VNAIAPILARSRLTAILAPFELTNADAMRSGSAIPSIAMRAFCNSYSPDHSPTAPPRGAHW